MQVCIYVCAGEAPFSLPAPPTRIFALSRMTPPPRDSPRRRGLEETSGSLHGLPGRNPHPFLVTGLKCHGQACAFPGPEGQILGDTCALYAGLPGEVSSGDTEALTLMEGLWLQRLARRAGTLNVITHPCRENHVLPLPQGRNLWML